VTSPEEHDPAGHRFYDPDPSVYGAAPPEVEDAIHREWRGHLPLPSLAAVREAAAELRAAQARLDEAVRVARRDGCSQADIEREADGR
jgi:hypothetical protein